MNPLQGHIKPLSSFLCSPAMSRYGELTQTQYFCHHADTIFHPNSRYVTTKLRNVDETIIRSFRPSYFHISYRRRM